MIRLSSILAVGAVAFAGSAFAGDTLWGIDNGADTIGTFDSDAPGTFNRIGTTGIPGFVNNLEFDSLGTLYASDGSTLYTIDRGTGAASAVGSHNITNGESLTDFSYNDDTGVMWAVGTICGAQSSLYTVDLGSGAATFVCTTDLDGSCDVGLAWGGDGTLFGHDLVFDVIYSVDPNTCITTTVVDLPFDSNFGQGMCASADTNYHVAFNGDSFAGELYDFDAGGAYNFRGTLEPLQIAGADVEVAQQACLDLVVENLVGGESATFTVSGGQPGTRMAVLWGFGGDPSVFEDVNKWCATFGFDVRLKGRTIRIAGSSLFNDDGMAGFKRAIPAKNTGLDILFQAAERETCPGECMSDVIAETVG